MSRTNTDQTEIRMFGRLAQKSKKDTRVRRASPLPLRAIPNCHMDPSEPPLPPSFPPSPPAPEPEPSSSRILPPEPRAERPRKSRLYCKIKQKVELVFWLKNIKSKLKFVCTFMIVYSDRFTTFLVAIQNHIKSPVTLKPLLAKFSLVKYIHEITDSYLLTLDCRF